MSYAVSALIGIIIGIGSIFSPQPEQPVQQKEQTVQQDSK
jgi:hypothetical protein